MKRLTSLYYAGIALALAACGGTTTPVAVTPPSPPPVKQETSVVFIGDSITYRWKFAPGEELPASIVDVGISGQTSVDMLARFDADVMAHHPTLVHILAGTNDCRAAAGTTGEVPSFDSVREMVTRALASGARVIVGTVPPAPDSYAEYPGWTELVIAWNKEVRLESRIYGYEVAEYYFPLRAPGALLPDGIHPSVDGYALMLGVVTPLLQ